jgi:hypothetical protein
MLLEGTADVAKYVGQQVEVTGTIAAAELPLAGVPESHGGRTGSAGAPGSPARAGALEADAARGTEAVVGHHGDEPVVSSLSAPAQRMRVTAVRPVGGRCAP